MPINDKAFEAMKELINTTIHELVFLSQHLEDDQVDQAQDVLVTAQGNLERLSEQVQAHVETA